MQGSTKFENHVAWAQWRLKSPITQFKKRFSGNDTEPVDVKSKCVPTSVIFKSLISYTGYLWPLDVIRRCGPQLTLVQVTCIIVEMLLQWCYIVKVAVMNKIQLNLNQSTILSFKKMHLKISKRLSFCSFLNTLGGYFLLPAAWWAPYQIRKIAGCACAGNAWNAFPVTAG